LDNVHVAEPLDAGKQVGTTPCVTVTFRSL